MALRRAKSCGSPTCRSFHWTRQKQIFGRDCPPAAWSYSVRIFLFRRGSENPRRAQSRIFPLARGPSFFPPSPPPTQASFQCRAFGSGRRFFPFLLLFFHRDHLPRGYDGSFFLCAPFTPVGSWFFWMDDDHFFVDFFDSPERRFSARCRFSGRALSSLFVTPIEDFDQRSPRRVFPPAGSIFPLGMRWLATPGFSTIPLAYRTPAPFFPEKTHRTAPFPRPFFFPFDDSRWTVRRPNDLQDSHGSGCSSPFLRRFSFVFFLAWAAALLFFQAPIGFGPPFLLRFLLRPGRSALLFLFVCSPLRWLPTRLSFGGSFPALSARLFFFF